MYIHTQTHVHTDTCTYIYTNTQMYMHTHTDTYTQTYMYIHADTCTIVHSYTDTHTHVHTPPIKSCSTSLFTHRSWYCTLGGGREHSTHSLLCFHCAQLLSSLTAPSANDRSGLSSEPAHKRVLVDTLAPTIISTRHWRAGEWKFQAMD
ncbi:unnamed protein product [Staurois parvus]|uniref:Uncharacterized protein n=1 Tax=Staurois parvus TaxID=386267 RepID=A0ABN9HI42_9NEOB|nr:unnamed protein product [Staurois parvus]